MKRTVTAITPLFLMASLSMMAPAAEAAEPDPSWARLAADRSVPSQVWVEGGASSPEDKLVATYTVPAVTAAGPPAAQAPTINPNGHWQRDYYRNYFHSMASCQARNNQIMRGAIPGVDGTFCFRYPGDKKWSMHIHFEYPE